jgi:hypothetical protein
VGFGPPTSERDERRALSRGSNRPARRAAPADAGS